MKDLLLKVKKGKLQLEYFGNQWCETIGDNADSLEDAQYVSDFRKRRKRKNE